MADLACPSCGNPQLDVDEQNSVVYCKRCGFAAKVDPQTGEVNVINQGGVPQGQAGPGTAPKVYSSKSIFGMDAFTFFMLGTAVTLLLTVIGVLTLDLFVLIELVIVVLWLFKR
ncbi:MAG: hypothetical protein ABH803_03490 [Candidatus Micrarchaeota archaeon]